MKLVKQAVKRIVSSLGWELRRLTDVHVSFDNFRNLAQAYEHTLNAAAVTIPPNDRRATLLATLLGTPPAEAYAVIQALAATSRIEGAVCEFGVAQGETSALIANEIAASGKVLHLFDSFEGLPAPTERDELKDDIFNLGSMAAYRGLMASPEAMVRARLKAIDFPPDRVVVHRGFVEAGFGTAPDLPKRVSFVYLDFDFYEPIRLVLEWLDGIVRPGAVILVDDYDFFSTGAKTAVDEFVAVRNAKGTVYSCHVPPQALGHFAILTRVS